VHVHSVAVDADEDDDARAEDDDDSISAEIKSSSSSSSSPLSSSSITTCWTGIEFLEVDEDMVEWRDEDDKDDEAKTEAVSDVEGAKGEETGALRRGSRHSSHCAERGRRVSMSSGKGGTRKDG